MHHFERIFPGLYMLKVPFSTIWSAVFLVEGDQPVLVDSGPSSEAVDNCIIPALQDLGLRLDDISWLINTHAHGDHMGGNDRILRLAPSIKLAAIEEARDKMINPLKYNVLTRSRYPGFSPTPPKEIPGHVPELILKDGDVLAGRLKVIHTPGHDTECICLLDLKSKTLLTGDSLQAFGMIGVDGAGLAFYKDLPAYLKSIKIAESVGAENIVASHDYRPFGYSALGSDAVAVYLKTSTIACEIYGILVRNAVRHGIHELNKIAEYVLDQLAVEPPPLLFMTMYTVEEHIRKAGALIE